MKIINCFEMLRGGIIKVPKEYNYELRGWRRRLWQTLKILAVLFGVAIAWLIGIM